MGDSLAVELAALTRAALVQIQVPQPYYEPPKTRIIGQLTSFKSGYTLLPCETLHIDAYT